MRVYILHCTEFCVRIEAYTTNLAIEKFQATYPQYKGIQYYLVRIA